MNRDEKEKAGGETEMGCLIDRKGEELAYGASSHQLISRRITNFAQDQIPYFLDERDVQYFEVPEKEEE